MIYFTEKIILKDIKEEKYLEKYTTFMDGSLNILLKSNCKVNAILLKTLS